MKENKEEVIEYWESFLNSYLGQNYEPQDMVKFLNAFGYELIGLNEENPIIVLRYARAAFGVLNGRIGEILNEYESE